MAVTLSLNDYEIVTSRVKRGEENPGDAALLLRELEAVERKYRLQIEITNRYAETLRNVRAALAD